MQELEVGPRISLDLDCLSIREFCTFNSEVVKYFKSVAPDSYISEIEKLLEIGAAVVSRVQATQEIDYVESRIKDTLALVQEQYHNLLRQLTSQLDSSLNPHQAGSFLHQTQKLIAEQTQYVNQGLSALLKNTQEQIEKSTAKLDAGRIELDRKFDPNNKVSYLASLIDQIDSFEEKLHHQFSETDTASFIGKLKSAISLHFGENGQVLNLIDSKLQLSGQTPLNQIYLNLKGEITSLRDVVMKSIGQQELLETTTKKGFPFEEQVFTKLQEIARPFGDIVDDTSLKVVAITGSKKGDYVYSLVGSETKIVLDAKNYNKLKSLPAMLAYIQEAILERNAKFGIIVAPDVNSLQKQIGSWNVYGTCIITPIDYLEVSIKYAKFFLQFQSSAGDNANLGFVKQKLDLVQRKMKEIVSVKTKLTKLGNGVIASIEDIQKLVDQIRSEISDALTDVERELLKRS